MEDHKKLLTTDQAAVYLTSRSGFNIRVGMMNSWRINKKGPRYHKVAGLVGYDVTDLDAFLRASLVPIESKPVRVIARPMSAAMK